MSKNHPLVSILTDTKNRPQLIHLCIESIQKQTYQNYEHIIADGSDNDETEKVVSSYRDPRIKYVKVPTGGPVKQTRLAFEMSKGDFITFLDDDDEYLPEKIEKQLELIQSLPEDCGFIYGSMTYYDFQTKKQLYIHEANLTGGLELLPIAVANPVICGTPTLMYRRHVFESIGGTWVSGIGNERSDWALVCKTLKQGWKIGALKASYLRIYVNHSAVRLSNDKFYNDNAERYLRFHQYFLEEYQNVFETNPQAASLHLLECFSSCMELKKRLDGYQYWKRLMSVNPNVRNFARLIVKLIKSYM